MAPRPFSSTRSGQSLRRVDRCTSGLRVVAGVEHRATFKRPAEGEFVGVLEIAADRETACDPTDTNTHRLEVLDQQCRGRLPLEIGVRGDDDLLDVLISDTTT